MSEKREWRRVPVPKELMEKVDKMAHQSGYASSSEMVRDAIRRLLQDIEGQSRGHPPEKDP